MVEAVKMAHYNIRPAKDRCFGMCGSYLLEILLDICKISQPFRDCFSVAWAKCQRPNELQVTLGLGPVDNTTVPGCPMPKLGRKKAKKTVKNP